MATISTTTSAALPAVNVAATGKAYFLTDNNKFVVNTGSAWVEVHSDGTGTVPFENRWAVEFDQSGLAQHIDIDASSYDLSGDFGLSFWMNMTSDRYSTNGVMGINYDTSGANGWRLYRNSTNIFKLWTKNSSNSYANPLNGGTPLLNTWYHVVLTRSGSTLTLYMNGNSETTGTSSLDFSGSALKIADNYVWAGLFDDFAIFESALDQSAVTSLYNSGSPAEVSGASGYWRFGDDSNDSPSNGGNIATITDSSGNGNAATQSTLTKQPTFSDLTGEAIYV